MSVDLTGQNENGPVAQQIAQHFRLAERLGAETVTVAGATITDAILDLARSRNVTKIFIGKTNQPRWKRLLFGTAVDELLERSGEIDVYVIHGAEHPTSTLPPFAMRTSTDYRPYWISLFFIGITALAAHGLRLLHVADSEANTVMLFLAAVAWSAFRFGRGPAVFSSLTAVLVFDFFFVPPVHTFAVADTQYIVTFAVMLTIGLVISTLTSRLRAQVVNTRLRERRTSALYELGKQLSSLYGNAFLSGAAARKIGDLLSGEVAIYLQRTGGPLEIAAGSDSQIAGHAISVPAAQWVIDHQQIAGAGHQYSA